MRLPIGLLLCGSLLPASAQTGTATAPMVHLSGSVTDSLTGKPVYDSLVGIYSRDGRRLSITPVNSDGRYALFVAPPEAFELRVEMEHGYLDFRRQIGPITGDAAALQQDVRLQPKP